MRLDVGGNTFYIHESGVDNKNKSRPSLIFLHYFGGSARSWTEVIAQLEHDFHCIALDLRGFGLSNESNENAASFTLEDYADNLENLIAALEINNFVVVGHSMGGKFALEFAARQPKNLKSLILIAPSPPTPEPISDDERKHQIESHGTRAAAIETVNKATAFPLSETIFERAVEDNLRTSENAWRAWLETESKVDISDSMVKIVAPALVVSGAKDEAIKTEVLERELMPFLNNSKLVKIPDAGHLLPLEVPDKVAELIREFIS
ncbi:MAG: alpha/beta hydrolase [Pyrinomonadaceae bacterium]|nr:alpha/beta hydrolase [Pyrinomonadaceae bacterium]